MRTKPLIPEMCFTTTTEEDSECEEQLVTPHLEEDGSSLLISCSQCSIRVHTSQYSHTHSTEVIYSLYSDQSVFTQTLTHFLSFQVISTEMCNCRIRRQQTAHSLWQRMLTDLHNDLTVSLAELIHQCVSNNVSLSVCVFQAVMVWIQPV